MLMRILTMRVVHEKLENWKRYTKEIGFPGMLNQPGCRKISRMRRRGADSRRVDEVVTWWDSIEDLDRFEGEQRHARAECERRCTHDTTSS